MNDVPVGPWLVVWLVAASFVIVRHWRTGSSVGLVFAYTLSFGAMHALAPALYLLPWYYSDKLGLTALGLRESAIAMVAFAAGTELASAIARRRHEESDESLDATPKVDNRIILLCLVLGAIAYGIASPILSRLPSGAAIASTGATLGVVGISLKCWNAWAEGRIAALWGWVAATMALPIVTVLGQGFLGFGFAAMLSVLAFVASFYRPRLVVAGVGLVLLYLGLSVYVTYMRDRSDIRDVVWTGASIEERVQQLGDTATNAEWFDLNREAHIQRIDSRLNQDFLIGAAIVYMDSGMARPAGGETLWLGLIAMVPRALWPDKPTVAGSGTLVSDYTGILFAEGTSVGVGQVLEAYVNFGRAGIVIGFFVLGLALSLIDRAAHRRLRRESAIGFVMWYLPGVALLQVGGAFSEMTSTAAAAVVTASGVRWLAGRLYPDRRLASRGMDATDADATEPTA